MRLTRRNPVHRLRHLLASHDAAADPDPILLARFAARRDEGAFTSLVRRHSPLVLGTARRVLGNADDADDVFQAVFLTLARKANAIRCDGTLAPWLYRVTFRAALRARKRCRRTEPLPDRPAAPADPLAQMSGRELCSTIDVEVGRLSARLRSVVILCCLQGLTRDEAAANLGWSPATVKRRLARARDLLERRLRARGIALPAALAPVLLAVTPPASADAVAGTVDAALGRMTLPPHVRALCGAGSIAFKTWSAVGFATGVLMIGVVFGLRPPRPETPPTGPAAQPQSAPADAAAEAPADPLPAGAVARIGTTRFRHDEWLSQAVWSPDGRCIASTAGDTLIIWDAATGRELGRRSLADPARPAQGAVAQQIKYVRNLHWGKDGRTLFAVYGGWFKEYTWDGRELRFKENHAGGGEPVYIARSAGGRRFSATGTSANATDDQTGQVWPVPVPAGSTVTAAVVSPTTEQAVVATAGTPDQVKVFDLRSGRTVTQFDRLVRTLTFSNDGNTLATVIEDGGGRQSVELWDTTGWKSRQVIPYPKGTDRPAEIRALAVSPDGKLLVTGGADKTLRWWDAATGKETHREGPGWVYYNRAAFRPDGKVLLTVSHENHIRLWDVGTHKQLPLTDGPGWTIAAATFTPDGRRVLSVSENVVYAHDAATGRELWRGAEHTDTAVQVVVTPDGRTAISSGNDGRIIFRDAGTGQVARTIENPRHAVDLIAVSPDGRTLAALGGDAPDDAILRRWDVTTGKAYPDAPLPAKGPKYVASSIRYTPAGTGIVIASGTESQVPVFDPDRREFRQAFGPTDGGVNCADITADGRMAAAATAGGSVILWETATGQQRLMLKDVGYTTCLAFSPDGRLLAVANDGSHRLLRGDKEIAHTDGRLAVRLLDSFTGREVHRFTGHSGSVYRLAWSADGRRLLSGSHDASALVWDVTSAIRAKLPAGTLTDDEAARAVAGLAGGDGAAVYGQMTKLAGCPATAVKALRGIVRPVTAPDPEVVAGLIRDLDSPQFAARERAAGKLVGLGEAVEGPLRKSLEGMLSAEARARIEKVLAEVRPPDRRLRQGRAFEVLERIGDALCRRLLSELSAGAEGAWLTREAKATLGRLTPPSR